jgi:hypothetical protein
MKKINGKMIVKVIVRILHHFYQIILTLLVNDENTYRNIYLCKFVTLKIVHQDFANERIF